MGQGVCLQDRHPGGRCCEVVSVDDKDITGTGADQCAQHGRHARCSCCEHSMCQPLTGVVRGRERGGLVPVDGIEPTVGARQAQVRCWRLLRSRVHSGAREAAAAAGSSAAKDARAGRGPFCRPFADHVSSTHSTNSITGSLMSEPQQRPHLKKCLTFSATSAGV